MKVACARIYIHHGISLSSVPVFSLLSHLEGRFARDEIQVQDAAAGCAIAVGSIREPAGGAIEVAQVELQLLGQSRAGTCCEEKREGGEVKETGIKSGMETGID